MEEQRLVRQSSKQQVERSDSNLLNARQCNSSRHWPYQDDHVADCDLQFACFKNRLDEQSGGRSNVIMSFLTLSSPKETASRDMEEIRQTEIIFQVCDDLDRGI
jgi:hypothetical protein